MQTGLFIWQAWKLPPVAQLIDICTDYGVDRVAIKVLDCVNGIVKYNSDNWQGDANLKAYFNAFRDEGIVPEGWGYHTPIKPGPQGDAIEERREKLGFDTYHVNCEKEWKADPNPGAEMRLLLSKPKVGGFEMLFCSYRYPSYHPEIPWNAAMQHEGIDGASPQVYWIGAHNPAQQLNMSFEEYDVWHKPFYPILSLFTESNWKPTANEIREGINWCQVNNISRVYGWSFDRIVSENRMDWLAAFCDTVQPPPPPPPIDPIVPLYRASLKSAYQYANCRAGAGVQYADLGDLSRGAGSKTATVVPVVREDGDWAEVRFWVSKKHLRKE